jgi:hypothetical protein
VKDICWGGADTWTRYGLVFFKDSFPIFAHIFEMIAEEEGSQTATEKGEK